MLRKKEAITVITPIPGFIPRQLALDILHSHSEVIAVNPLVLGHKPIPAPREATADEYYSTWYEITERVQVIPGAGKVGSSKITFNGCFHNMPWGLQTHIYAPFSIDLRNRYRIAGNQPGIEPPEHRELGLESLGAPKDGLYLREDIEIRCNISLVSFVKAQMKAASKEMVQRIIRKAELLDAGVLQAMMSPDGQLKTINPNDRSQATAGNAAMGSPMPSAGGGSRPQSYQASAMSPTYAQFARPGTSSSSSPGYPTSPGPYHQWQQPMTPPPIPPKEQNNSSPQPMELPGDFTFAQPQQSPGLHPDHAAPHHYLYPNSSPGSPDPRMSQYSSSTADKRASMGSQHSPGYAPAGYTAELATHNEAPEYRAYSR